MKLQDKQEALNNALESFKFPQKYFIQLADARCGHRFAIASISEYKGGIITHTNYMKYDEMNAFLRGYVQATKNPFQ